jgi:PIN domain nuclease of toxin-antitoxin system
LLEVVSGYLLDTHVLVTVMHSPERIPEGVLRSLADPAVDRWVSVVSAFEIGVKNSIGKLDLPPAFERSFQTAYNDVVFDLAAKSLDVRLHHAARVRTLPLIHRDPFDRLLIAQALEEDLILVSNDRHFNTYPGLKVLAE